MRQIKLRGKLNQIREGFPDLALVVWEEVNFVKYRDAHAVHNQLLGQLLTWCEDAGVQYSPIPVQTIKKHATGKGNASKDMMLAAARSRWPLSAFVDHNEADSRWALDCKMAEIGESER